MNNLQLRITLTVTGKDEETYDIGAKIEGNVSPRAIHYLVFNAIAACNKALDEYCRNSLANAEVQKISHN